MVTNEIEMYLPYIIVVLGIASIFAIIFHFSKDEKKKRIGDKIFKVVLIVIIVTAYTYLIGPTAEKFRK